VIQETDPAGAMMMAAQVVEQLGEDDAAVKRARLGARILSCGGSFVPGSYGREVR